MSHDQVAQIFRRQAGLASWAQLLEHGHTPASVRTLVRRGVYNQLGRGVYELAGTPPTDRRRIHLALLQVGPMAAASHRTSAHVLGFDTFHPLGQVEITVPHSRRAQVPDVVLHRTRRLERVDLVTVEGIRCTSATRTIIDLAGYLSERELLTAIGSALRDGRTSMATLHRRLSALRGPGRHGTLALDRALRLMPGGGLHSVLEVDFLTISRRVRSEPPATQVTIVVGGRRYRVDFAYPPSPVLVEVDGHGHHATGTDRTADSRRRRDLIAAGYEVLTFTSYEIFHEPDRVAADLRRALSRHFPIGA
jgi:hypothetical protein